MYRKRGTESLAIWLSIIDCHHEIRIGSAVLPACPQNDKPRYQMLDFSTSNDWSAIANKGVTATWTSLRCLNAADKTDTSCDLNKHDRVMFGLTQSVSTHARYRMPFVLIHDVRVAHGELMKRVELAAV